MQKNIKDTNAFRLPVMWGLLHGINDWVAGYMLATFSILSDRKEGMLMLIVYAIIGFGGQLPVGMWLDSTRSFKAFSKAALFLLMLAPLAWLFNPYAGIIVAGFSSAFVHVTGGAVCLQTANNKVGPLGIFTAPGVLGLVLGTVSSALSSYWLFAMVVVVAAIGYFILQPKSLIFLQYNQSAKPLLDGHDWLMIGILLTVTIRSLVYDIIQHVGQHWQQGLLVIGISAFLGKIIGGFVADKIGWKTWVYITLPLAFVLLQFGRDNIYMLGFGIACLQSSVPISLLLMRQSMPQYPGVSSAMVLGVGIALAGLPMYLVNQIYVIQGWFGIVGITAALVILMIILFYIYKGITVLKYNR